MAVTLRNRTVAVLFKVRISILTWCYTTLSVLWMLGCSVKKLEGQGKGYSLIMICCPVDVPNAILVNIENDNKNT